jgi:hypothetical protein
MTKLMPLTDLRLFLVSAKRATYAAGGSQSRAAVVPLLRGTHQMEYAEGDLLYRDIYFGEDFFRGQEVVYAAADPMWSMCYAEGWTAALAESGEAGRVSDVLQASLRLVPGEYPCRGPLQHREGPYTYTNKPEGEVRRFWGIERIAREGSVLFELRYCGGRLACAVL